MYSNVSNRTHPSVRFPLSVDPQTPAARLRLRPRKGIRSLGNQQTGDHCERLPDQWNTGITTRFIWHNTTCRKLAERTPPAWFHRVGRDQLQQVLVTTQLVEQWGRAWLECWGGVCFSQPEAFWSQTIQNTALTLLPVPRVRARAELGFVHASYFRSKHVGSTSGSLITFISLPRLWFDLCPFEGCFDKCAINLVKEF